VVTDLETHKVLLCSTPVQCKRTI